MKEDKNLSFWERYLTNEIGIEFKACLYFFAILFFYCVYRVICGSWEAGIVHMTEMIISCYIICYIQFFAFANFDEADDLKGREVAGITVCTLIYCVLSYVFGWFAKNMTATFVFASYLVIVYLCVFLIYKIKRRIDDKKLNEELKQFKAEHKK